MNWEETKKLFKIPVIYQNCCFDNCTKIPKKLVDLGKFWVKYDKKPSMYIFGNTGSGKTYFAISIFRELIELQYPWVLYKSSIDLDDELLNASLNGNESNVLVKYKEANIIIIDDLGVERGTDRTIRQWFSIIDYRVSNNLPTIITTNLSKEDKFWGERINSRLETFLNVEFPKKDNRLDHKLDFMEAFKSQS